MKAMRLYTAIGGADEELLARCEETRVKHVAVLWKKATVAAACLCVLTVAAFAGYRLLPIFNAPDTGIGLSAESDVSASANSSETGKYVPSKEIIQSYEEKEDNVTHSNLYAAPKTGQWIMESDISMALEEHGGEDVLYYVFFTLSTGESDLGEYEIFDTGSPEMTAELERLSDLGYHVGYAETWTYRGEGEKVYYTYAAGYLTEDQLINFNSNEQYGYHFGFPTNGNSEPVDAGEGIVTEYDFGEGIRFE